ncbi:MAG: ankyrin repeat domain-containing protein [Planctomycetes bacterium]|nr:ankyrin repeat domain-containing protein [Planctomycetota bacterium]
MQSPLSILIATLVALLSAFAPGCARPTTPLARAAVEGDTEAVDALLAAGSDPMALDGAGLSAAHWAARRGPPETLRLLLAAGTPPDLRDARPAYGWTLLVSCTHTGRPETLSALLAAGADPDAPSSDGTTPLRGALLRSELDEPTRAEMLRRLIAAGADVRGTFARDPSLLAKLVASGEAELVDVVLTALPDLRLGHAFRDDFARTLARMRGDDELLARVDAAPGR